MTTTATTVPTDLTFAAVEHAAEVVAAEVAPTPLLSHPLLDRSVGARVLVKHENALPTSAFKIRGGIYLASALGDEEVAGGLVTCSTGNHAQSIAHAARLAGTTATVVMPGCAPEGKRAAVEALGARVVVEGDTMADAAAGARQLAAAGAAYIDPTDPRIILGHATLYLELFRARPDLAAVYVPIGSGTGAVGACLVRDRLAPGCRVVGVQSTAAPAVWRSWRSGEIQSAEATTRASGLATSNGYPNTHPLLRAGLQDFLLVPDEDLDAAARRLATVAHTLAELAGAASLAGLLADPARPGTARPGSPDRPVAVVVTGGNASSDEIARLSA
ncbi:threonine ammonia-lyase [Nocardioides panacisoli]|uniref:Threonine dehydratase n=1 Tax=Nocardioides panacisoli TaxID=627624 RepID=A0ABP7I3P0_9ACTN